MQRTTTIAALLLTCSLLSQENKAPIHPIIYNDKTTGEWVHSQDQRTWTMTYTYGIGYRRDRQKFRAATDRSVSYFHNFNTIQNAACFTFAWERILIRLGGDYGWLINGDLNTKAPGGVFQEPAQNFPTFKMGSGYTADAYTALGCRIKFWTFGRGSFSFIPALGAIYSHFNAYPRQQNRSPVPASPLVQPAGTSGYTSLEYTRPIQQDWFGPYAEGRIAFSWKKEWRIDLYYQYIPVDFRQTMTQSAGNMFFNPPGSLVTASTSQERLSSKSDTTRTQLGGADISYRSPNHWQLGTHFEGASTWSNTAHTISHIKTDALLPADATTHTSAKERLSVQWVRYSINFFSSYWF